MTFPSISPAVRLRPSIVVVDDDPAVCRMLLRNLGASFRVSVADCGATALRLLDLAPQAMVADWHLPDMDGAALLEAVHTRLPRLPVVVITGDTSFATARDALPHARALFGKPISMPALTKVLHEATAPSPSEFSATLGSLRFDPLRAVVSTPLASEVQLTAAERRVFSALWARAGEVVTARTIAELAAGFAPRLASEASDCARRYVHQLRAKLGPWVIETDRRRGYRLRVTPPPRDRP